MIDIPLHTPIFPYYRNIFLYLLFLNLEFTSSVLILYLLRPVSPGQTTRVVGNATPLDTHVAGKTLHPTRRIRRDDNVLFGPT